MGVHVAKPYLQSIMQEALKEKDSVELENQITQFCHIVQETIEQLKTNEL
jgi:F0F1-type ATP synthase delta subunit